MTCASPHFGSNLAIFVCLFCFIALTQIIPVRSYVGKGESGNKKRRTRKLSNLSRRRKYPAGVKSNRNGTLRTKTLHRVGPRLLNFKGLFESHLETQRGNTTYTPVLDVCASDGFKCLSSTKPWSRAQRIIQKFKKAKTLRRAQSAFIKLRLNLKGYDARPKIKRISRSVGSFSVFLYFTFNSSPPQILNLNTETPYSVFDTTSEMLPFFDLTALIDEGFRVKVLLAEMMDTEASPVAALHSGRKKPTLAATSTVACPG